MLYLIRHGEAEGNAEGRIMGQQDLPLTEHGRAQAQALGQWLRSRGITFAAIHSSGLQRAKVTAEILAATCGGGQVLVREDLRELGRGAVEGKTYAEAAELRRLPGVAESFEPEERVALRIARVAAELRTASMQSEVAAVAHGGSISRLLRWYLGLPPTVRSGETGFSLHNTSVTVLEVTPSRTVVHCANAMYHLPDEAMHWKRR